MPSEPAVLPCASRDPRRVGFLLEGIGRGADGELCLQSQDGLVSDCALQLMEWMRLATGSESAPREHDRRMRLAVATDAGVKQRWAFVTGPFKGSSWARPWPEHLRRL
jgi:hypothetical protein